MSGGARDWEGDARLSGLWESPSRGAPAPKGGGDRDGRVRCSRCGAVVSSPVPEGTVVRAWVECPECIEKGAPSPVTAAGEEQVLRVCCGCHAVGEFEHHPDDVPDACEECGEPWLVFSARPEPSKDTHTTPWGRA